MVAVGSGPYRYDLIEGWGTLPEGMSFGVVTGVAVDSQERVIVCQQQMEPPVIVFDRDGNYLSSWGVGLLPEPHTLFVDSDDIVYVPDRVAHVAMKFTVDGEPLMELGNRGQPSDTGCVENEGVVLRAGGPFNTPTRMSPSPSGDIYVSDGYRNCRVHRFSSDGKLISSWGQPGESAPGEIRSPHCLWVMSDGKVYVCDRLNNRIQIFSPTGEFIGQWRDLDWPTDLFVDPNGDFFVAERPNHEAQVNSMVVRDGSGREKARWDTPRNHQTWHDSHGNMFLVMGQFAEPRDKAIYKYVRNA
jgi:DNA-binding beta-propeller fold protein YncE